MISVSIAGEQKSLADVSERWVNKAINPSRARGLPICVQVLVQENDLNVRLTTPGCGEGGAGGRRPNAREAQVIKLWRTLGLSSGNFEGGNLIAFLKQLQKRFL